MIISENIFKQVLIESGIRDIRNLADRYKKAKIYFHQDLDGVTSAITMREYLNKYGIEVVDSEVIQYGEKEFAIKKPEAKGDVMPVLVDFAHGKPMFVIHTDHHDSQAGVEKDTKTSFRQSRSNVETLSQIITTDVFPPKDIKTISTVDSADFSRMGITVDEVMNFIFNLNKEESVTKNRTLMGLVTNKLILAYKNKPNFLERLVMESSPSLVSIYMNVVKLSKEGGYAPPTELKKNQEKYIQNQKENDKVKYNEEYGIIVQLGGGNMFKPGSYDRYTPFKNHPDANYLMLLWPGMLLQVSCNPFKSSRSLKGVDLGEIMSVVLEKYKQELQSHMITVGDIKNISENNKHFSQDSVGFTFKDLVALYEDTDGGILGINETPKGSPSDYTVERWQNAIKKIMDKPYNKLGTKERKAIDMLSVSAWDVIKANSGGHKCITNVSGIPYLGSVGTDWLKRITKVFNKELKDRIDSEK